jgi:hypothetical protein
LVEIKEVVNVDDEHINALLQYAAEYQHSHNEAGLKNVFCLERLVDGNWCIVARTVAHDLRVCTSCGAVELETARLRTARITTTYSEHAAFAVFCHGCAAGVEATNARMVAEFKRSAN